MKTTKLFYFIYTIFVVWVTEYQCTLVSNEIHYATRSFKYMPVDHFGYSNKDTFELRYLINDTWWDRDGSGPIFLYSGNEGDIETFAENTGFMWDIAWEYQALLLFIEHRYFGHSLPYGNNSFVNSTYTNYLTSEQALADFAQGVTTLKQEYNVPQSKVVVFGGSYGGMLAAWMRLKYPNIVVGAIAASAPVAWFDNLTDCNAYTLSVTNSFTRESPHCPDNIKQSWKIINDAAKSAEGLSNLQKHLHLCDPLTSVEDVDNLKGWITNTWGSMAMVNYPYPTSFLAPLPAWPIKEVCKGLSGSSMSDADILTGISAGLNVYYNYTGDTPCFNISVDADAVLGARGWYYQVCTEMVMPMCQGGPGDMMEPESWNLTSYIENCEKEYGVTVRPDWAVIQYGGRDLSGASNIVLSNGKLDPWSPGGIHTSLSDSVIAVEIEDGAHHLDLRFSNPADPMSVRAARELEKDMISKWLSDGSYVHTNSVVKQIHHKRYMFITLLGVGFVTAIIITILIGLSRRKHVNNRTTVPCDNTTTITKRVNQQRYIPMCQDDIVVARI